MEAAVDFDCYYYSMMDCYAIDFGLMWRKQLQRRHLVDFGKDFVLG
jgi:hypothetical protein